MFDYKQSLKDNTAGYILFISYSINNKTSVSQHWFEEKDSLLTQFDSWQEHFKKQEAFSKVNQIDYCYSITILRAVCFKASGGFMSTTMTRDELVAEINETKVLA